TELTISSPDPNSGGRYPVEITASSSTVTKSLYVYLNLKPPAPDVGPNLLTPTDGMTDTVLTPVFSWEPYSSQLYT
ncbi:MAG: hypothetical protein GWN55_05960, partial [Phycisphaerae bacterium]|nr:hypothetical protein [Phycisphaerae bacterium]NIV00860.1 hypothetical protein [Phycisphaerae bacterium]NIV69811.1 hypothetical protein [Phycisphaerae bacterium]